MSDIRRLADRIVSRCATASSPACSTPSRSTMRARSTPCSASKIHLDQIVAEGCRQAGPDQSRACASPPGARPFSLTLGDGEVVAITGLVGVGKTAFAETLFGLRKPLSGTMTLRGKPYAPRSTGEAIAAGVFLVAKDRGENGIVGGLQHLGEYQPALPQAHVALRRSQARRSERATARRQIDDLGIVCRSEKDEMATLSGGNQQKVMVARWMAQHGEPVHPRRAVPGRRHLGQARHRRQAAGKRRRPRHAVVRHRTRRGAGDGGPHPGDVGADDRRRAPQRRCRHRPPAGRDRRRPLHSAA